MTHEAHEMPLASRLAEQAIRKWLDTHTALTMAGAAGKPGEAEYERGLHDGIERLRDHLDDYWYALIPALLDELRRAGLLPVNA